MSKKDLNVTIEVVKGNIIDAETGELLMASEDFKNYSGKEVKMIDTGDSLAMGIAMPSNMQQPHDFLYNIDEYKLTNRATHSKKLEVCENMYNYEGIVGTVTDLYVDLANTSLIPNNIDNEEALHLFNLFNRNLNRTLQTAPHGLTSFLERGYKQYLIYGDVYPSETWRNFKDPASGKSFNMPVNIMYLNPKSITFDEEKILDGIEIMTMKSGKKEGSTLNRNIVKHLKRKSNDWEPYGVPFLLKAFSAVASKKRLRRLDDTTIEGLINYLTVFKIGSPNEKSPYHKVSRARLRAFANMITNPTASTTLVWPHDIDVITVGPDGKVLDFDEKYKAANSDIIEALGIGASILNNKFDEESVMILVETLDSMRNSFLDYLTELYETMFLKNGIKLDKPIELKFVNIKLADVLSKLKSMVLSFYDRGLLSIETALTNGGHEFKTELNRKEKEVGHKELFEVPNLPFSTTKEEVNDDSKTNKTDKQTRDDGRPVDKQRVEKLKVDNEIKEEKPKKEIGNQLAKADLDFIEKYSEALGNRYQRILDSLVNFMEGNETVRPEDLTLLIASGFSEMETYSTTVLKVVYDSMILGSDGDVSDFMFQKLEDWNSFYMNRFKDKLMKSVSNATKVLNEISEESFMLTAFVISSFEKERYRIAMYAEEGYIKSTLAGTLEDKRKTGYSGGYWVTAGDDRVCDVCSAMDGNWYDLNTLFANQPVHNNCRCSVAYTIDNPNVDAIQNNTPVVKDNNNPNKLL